MSARIVKLQLGRQTGIRQVLTSHAVCNNGQTVKRLEVTAIEASFKLAQVAMQILVAPPVVYPVMAALQASPVAFNAVRVNATVNVLLLSVIYG